MMNFEVERRNDHILKTATPAFAVWFKRFLNETKEGCISQVIQIDYSPSIAIERYL